MAANGRMTIHLIKLSVGPENLSELEAWQAQRLRDLKRAGRTPELMHVTRNTPKRAEEVLAGGSIYWVIKGWLVARQRLVELRPLIHDGMPYCGLVCAPEMIRVAPRKHRPFQGWRYLKPEDAPRDLAKGEVDDDVPEELRRELSTLGLI